VEYVGLIAMMIVGLGSSAVLFWLSAWARKVVDRADPSRPELRDAGPSYAYDDARPDGNGGAVSPGSLDLDGTAPVLPLRRSLARYLFAATVAVVLHTALFFFYIWGATLAETGLLGFIAILCFSSCLLVGLIYSWSRGAADVMKKTGS
jgi:hypothetical protein